MKLKRFLNIVFKEVPLYYIGSLISFLPNNGITCRIRGFLSSLCFKKPTKKLKLAQGSIINYPENIVIGRNVYIAHRAYINAKYGIEIADNVVVGPNCVIVTSNHSIKEGKVCNEGARGKVYIGKGTWIAANVVITPGTSIGSNVIVAAGAVVTKNIPDNVVAGGVPAKVIKNNN